jgi:glycosyltransferase involved in cell wall biosynthesis
MIIHAHILSWNEEKILPYTLDHYSNICSKIFIHDNMSTDGSDEIYKKYPKVTILKWDSGNEINELNYTKIKSESYKQYSRGEDVDWVIVCDCDEFLYHENLMEKLKEYKSIGVTVPRIDGHDMVSEIFPTYDGIPLTEKVKIGSDTYGPMCKNIIFNPKLDVQYGIGGHSFGSNGTVYSESADLKLLHYKFLGKDYVKRAYVARAKRLSEFNKQHKFGEHYFNLPFEYMDKMLSEKRQII